MKTNTSIGLLLLLATTCFAQVETAPVEEEAAEVPRYAVEIIVFAYAQDVSVGSEVFLPDGIDDSLATRDDELVFDDAEPATADEQQAPVRLRQIDLQLLRDEQLTLRDIRRRMERLEVYDPLMHFGWIQPTYPQEETPAIKLRQFGRAPQGLDGELTLYLSRFLHLVVDMTLQDENNALTASPAYRFDDDRMLGSPAAGPGPGPVVFRISEDRIVKNGDTRYFDHPKFGVLAKVTRIADENSAAIARQN